MKRIVVWIYGITVIGFGACTPWAIAPFWLAVPMSAYCIYYGAAGINAFEVDRKRCNAFAGLCRRCGYDLRATSDRCPECGLATKNDEL